MQKERHKEVPASYLVLIKDGKVLLLRRFNTGYNDGNYSLPAGHVDKDETFTQCIVREAKEEIGIDLEPEDLRVCHVMHRFSGKEWAENGYRIDIFFMAEKWQGDPRIEEPQKCDDLHWFDLENLPGNMVPEVKQAIECIRDKVFYSEFGWK